MDLSAFVPNSFQLRHISRQCLIVYVGALTDGCMLEQAAKHSQKKEMSRANKATVAHRVKHPIPLSVCHQPPAFEFLSRLISPCCGQFATAWANAGFHGHQVQIFPPQSRVWSLQRKPDPSTWHFIPVSSFRECSFVLADSLQNTGRYETRDLPPLAIYTLWPMRNVHHNPFTLHELGLICSDQYSNDVTLIQWTCRFKPEMSMFSLSALKHVNTGATYHHCIF